MEQEKQRAFQIDASDNVATALTAIRAGIVEVIGLGQPKELIAVTDVPIGHKISLRDIKKEEDIIKYGVRIGRANIDIPAGSWIHLHNIRSIYDERSSHLDAVTGAPKDTHYE